MGYVSLQRPVLHKFPIDPAARTWSDQRRLDAKAKIDWLEARPGAMMVRLVRQQWVKQ
jgi:hypothetical protein